MTGEAPKAPAIPSPPKRSPSSTPLSMMQRWSDHLDFLRDGAKVIKGDFKKAKAGE